MKITVEIAKEIFAYEPETGLFHYKHRSRGYFRTDREFIEWNENNAGTECLTELTPKGYFSGWTLNQTVLAHRVAFMIAHGTEPDQVDHINGVRSDNRVENLRSVTKAENNKNIRLSPRNRFGIPGLWLLPKTGKWVATIRAGGPKIHLGTFDHKFEACAARKSAELKLGYHGNHGKPAVTA